MAQINEANRTSAQAEERRRTSHLRRAVVRRLADKTGMARPDILRLYWSRIGGQQKVLADANELK